MIISVDTEKTFENFQYSFVIKATWKGEIEKTFLQLIKGAKFIIEIY